MACVSAPVHVGPQGRIVLPAELRRELSLAPGERLIARVEDGHLVLERPDDVIARIQRRFVELVPRDVSLADELIAERREEARKEAEEA